MMVEVWTYTGDDQVTRYLNRQVAVYVDGNGNKRCGGCRKVSNKVHARCAKL